MLITDLTRLLFEPHDTVGCTFIVLRLIQPHRRCFCIGMLQARAPHLAATLALFINIVLLRSHHVLVLVLSLYRVWRVKRSGQMLYGVFATQS